RGTAPDAGDAPADIHGGRHGADPAAHADPARRRRRDDLLPRVPAAAKRRGRHDMAADTPLSRRRRRGGEMSDFKPTTKTKIKRLNKRAHYDRATTYAVLDAGLVAHVGYVFDGHPYVTSTSYWR